MLAFPGPFGVIEHAAQSDVAPEKEHGTQVSESARSLGFKGNIIGINLLTERLDLVPRVRGMVDRDKAWNQSDDPEVLSRLLDDDLLENRLFTLEKVTLNLTQLAAAGIKHSVINLSMGDGQMSDANRWLNRVLPVDSTKSEEVNEAEGKAQRVKYALALGIDPSLFDAEDESVRESVRAEFVQKLLDRSELVEKSPAYLAAKEEYDLVVNLLSMRNNSIVVAAGNEQTLPDFLVDLGRSQTPPQIPENFLVNSLANQNTLVVGALDGESVAEYSSRFPSVKVYADGKLGDIDGTSFAAPRVAAMLADLYGSQPAARSQTEGKFFESYCYTINGESRLNVEAAKLGLAGSAQRAAIPGLHP